jgi:hypothetical protein
VKRAEKVCKRNTSRGHRAVLGLARHLPMPAPAKVVEQPSKVVRYEFDMVYGQKIIDPRLIFRINGKEVAARGHDAIQRILQP